MFKRLWRIEPDKRRVGRKEVLCGGHPNSREWAHLSPVPSEKSPNARAEEALRKAFEEIKGLKDQLYRENLALKEEID